ncbi:MAG: acyl-CoA thioesterase [Bacteroidota bacterium]
MTETLFSVKLKLRIDWGDMDSFGHVNNVSIFSYIQASRVHYLEKTGLMKMQKELKIGPILASCKCEFKKTLYYPGQITIHSRVEFIKNTSFCIHHRILDDKNQLAAEARDILVLYDFTNDIKVQIPGKIRVQFEKLENRRF